MNKFLHTPTRPIEVSDKKISVLLDEMMYTGFQGRKLAECADIWREMLKEEEITVWMGKIIAYLIRERLIDVLVSTGAQLFHDTHEAMGNPHYVGSHTADDVELLEQGVDRIYDVFADEHKFRKTDRKVHDFIMSLDENYAYSSREFLHLLGKELIEKYDAKDSILAEATKQKIPVFAPALCDSSIGYSFVMARRGVRDSKSGEKIELNGKKKRIMVDQMKDADETVQIAAESRKSGVIYLGGGVPKNFIQQTELVNLIFGTELPGHEYAIQITADSPQWGGLSGCTFEEAQSWGKIAKKAKKATCFSDATIALPIITHALHETVSKRAKKPSFDWSGEMLKIKYE